MNFKLIAPQPHATIANYLTNPPKQTLIEEAREPLPTRFIPANISSEAKQSCLVENQIYLQLHTNLRNLQSYQLIYTNFKQIVTELTQRFTTTPSGKSLTILQGIANQLEAIDPAYVDWNNQEQLIGSMQKLKALVKLLAQESSNLQNLDPNLLRDPSSYQVYNELAKLTQGSNNYHFEISKKIHANENSITPPTNLGSNAGRLSITDLVSSQLLTQTIMEFFNRPAPILLTNEGFLSDLTNYILSQKNDNEYTGAPVKLIHQSDLPAQAILEIQLAITAYHIYLCICKSSSSPQLLVNAIFDFNHFTKSGNHYQEFRSLIKSVLGKYFHQPQENADKELINHILPNKSGAILAAAQNYLHAQQLIPVVRPLYAPHKHFYCAHFIIDSIATAITTKFVNRAEILKQINSKLTQEFGEGAPFISFNQLKNYQTNFLAQLAKYNSNLYNYLKEPFTYNPQHVTKLNNEVAPHQAANHMTTPTESLSLEQNITDFFTKLEPNPCENEHLDKLSELIQVPANRKLTPSSLQKIYRASQLPADFNREGILVITLYLIYLILREYQQSNKNPQVIKDNLCNFSYFSQGTEQYARLTKLMDTLFKKYAINRVNNAINDFIIMHDKEIVIATQQYFWNQGLISTSRLFYRANLHKQYGIFATAQEIKHEPGVINLSRYQQLKYINNKLEQKIGETAPLLSLNNIIHIRGDNKSTTTKKSRNHMNAVSQANSTTSLTKRKGEDLALIIN
jgi:hypothetical protein